MKKFGFGLMRLPILDGDSKKIDIKTLTKMADAFIQAGGTYFDTAYVYHRGSSEKAFYEAVVKRHPRQSYTIADKLPMFLITEVEQMETIFEKQLQRCGVDYFDYYLLHSLDATSYKTVQELGAFGYIGNLKKRGRVKNIGFSFHDTPEVLETILSEHPEIDFVQLQINYLDWEETTLRAKELYDLAVRYNKPVIVMEPIKGGALANLPEKAANLLKKHNANRSHAEWALFFAATHPNVKMVLSGMSTQSQMNENIVSMSAFKSLEKSQIDMLLQAANIIRKTVSVPCTSCGYCLESCPKNIPIPEIFEICNNLYRFGAPQRPAARNAYGFAVQNKGKASDCIECGKCETLCPQHIEIRSCLKEAARDLE